MKIYIQTDLEGVAGVTFFENSADTSVENANHRQRMRLLLTGEVQAAARGAFAAGATEVLVNDSHASGYNIQFEDLDPRCEIIHGRNFSGPHWLPEFDASFHALVLVGMHAMGGTRNAILPHSLYEVNGGDLYLGEASMAAALAGHRGVPTVFASGDDKITDELREKIPGIRTAVVKKGLGAYQARSLTPSRARQLIEQNVEESIRAAGSISPYVVPGPVSLNLLESEGHAPPFEPVLAEAVLADNIEEAFLCLQEQMPWTRFPVEVPDGFTYP